MVMWQKRVFQQQAWKRRGRLWNMLEGQRGLKQQKSKDVVKDVWWKRLRQGTTILSADVLPHLFTYPLH